MSLNDRLPTLGMHASDRLVMALRAFANAVPIIGGALAEIVTEIVPSQRIDRIEIYLKLLSEQLAEHVRCDGERRDAEQLLANKMIQPENVDLIEEGARIASRAISGIRLNYISRCVATGIASEERAKLHQKRILALVEQLDDEEILILEAYGCSDHSKFDRLRPPPAVISAPASVLEQNALYEAAIAKLERLSLLRFRERYKDVELPQTSGRRSEKLKIPDIDAFGKPSGYRDITPLGRLVLNSIGLPCSSSGGLVTRPLPQP